MGAYTFYNDVEIGENLNKLRDTELKELISETNRESHRVYFAIEHEYSVKKVLKKPLKKSLYALYVKTVLGEVKCINFAPLSDLKSSSLNYVVDKAFIMTYLFGILTGLKIVKNK